MNLTPNAEVTVPSDDQKIEVLMKDLKKVQNMEDRIKKELRILILKTQKQYE